MLLVLKLRGSTHVTSETKVNIKLNFRGFVVRARKIDSAGGVPAEDLYPITVHADMPQPRARYPSISIGNEMSSADAVPAEDVLHVAAHAFVRRVLAALSG